MKKRAIESMTGFGAGETRIPSQGKISCEIRSTNHKFLETVLHLPEGYLSLEERVKNEISAYLKRGRVVCAITVTGSFTSEVFVNESLLNGYARAIRRIGTRLKLTNDVSLDTLVNLPGVLSTAENRIAPNKLWLVLQKAVDGALKDLHATRLREGEKLVAHLARLSGELNKDLSFVKDRFKKSISEKLPQLKTAVEKTVFLKEIDITEELERLTFHISSLNAKLRGPGPVGKELDFICQEMQREANTMGAKSSDVKITGKVVQMKSTIEKLREQVQNIE